MLHATAYSLSPPERHVRLHCLICHRVYGRSIGLLYLLACLFYGSSHSLACLCDTKPRTGMELVPGQYLPALDYYLLAA